MGSDFGRAMGDAIIGMIICAALAGIGFGAVLCWLIPAIYHHISINIH